MAISVVTLSLSGLVLFVTVSVSPMLSKTLSSVLMRKETYLLTKTYIIRFVCMSKLIAKIVLTHSPLPDRLCIS